MLPTSNEIQHLDKSRCLEKNYEIIERKREKE